MPSFTWRLDHVFGWRLRLMEGRDIRLLAGTPPSFHYSGVP